MDSMGEMESMIINYESILHLNDNTFEYLIDGEVITATYAGVTDTFDFTDMPDGYVDFLMIETILEYNPIIKAERVNGELIVNLIQFTYTAPVTEEMEATNIGEDEMAN